MSEKDSEAVELFYYLIKHFNFRTYNPKGKYAVIAFTIDDEYVNEQLTKFIYNHEFYKK